MTIRLKAIFVTLTVASATAWAGTDVEAGLELLRENAENSKSNFSQYKTNMDISSKNIVETTRAVKEIRDQRKQLKDNVSNIEKNKGALDEMKAKLEGHRQAEEAKLTDEDKQIAEVRALLEKLEANKRQRLENIATYNSRIAEIEKEKSDWAAQRQAASVLTQEIDSKEKEALAEREKWINKKKGYRAEAIKWQKQNLAAEQTYQKYKRLAE